MRRPRRSESETARLVMDAAVEHVAEHGLRATLDLPMEDVITAADVARATAYRLWPTRERFMADALDRIADGQTIPTLGPGVIESVVRDVAAGTTGGTAPLDVACDLMAHAVAREFDVLAASEAWRAFLAFEAVAASIPDNERRARLLGRLVEVEAQHTASLADLYGAVARALGLRPASRDALLDAAHAARVLARGLVHDAVREGTTEADRTTARRRLAVATAALVRDALEPDGTGELPRDWAGAVVTVILAHERDESRDSTPAAVHSP